MKFNEMLSGLQGVESIADDVLIFGRGETIEEAMVDHNKNLDALMERLEKNNCKLNKTKLNLCKTSVKFFGHYLTTEGLVADEEKISAIRDFPVPKDKKELQRFLGMVTFLGRYVNNLSQEAAALHQIARPKSDWQWTEMEQQEFEKLKNVMSELNRLQYFDTTKEIVMECDACSEGLGAMLTQDGKPFAFASRRLSNAEKNGYAMIEKEMAAIVFGCTRFHQMLIGNRTIVRTDHKPLINIAEKPMSDAPKRLQTMIMVLQKYNLKFEYIKGKDNIVADALSRAPVDDPSEDEFDSKAMLYEVKCDATAQSWCKNVKLIEDVSMKSRRVEDIREATRLDPTLQLIKQLIVNGWPEDMKKLRDDVKVFDKYKDELAWQDDLVFYGKRIVIPMSRRRLLIDKLHASHQGIEATIKLAKENVFWPGMSKQIEDKVKMCETCAKFSASQQKQPMQSHEVPQYPFQYVSMDCFEQQLGGKKRNWLVTVDHYSDFFELDILETMTSRSVIKESKANFARYGVPQRVCTDMGTNFVSRESQKFAKEWGFEQVTSSPNHQQGNGKAEAAVKIAKNLIKKAEEDGGDYELALLHWRNTPNKMGSSPNQRLMSRQTQTMIPTPIENLKPKIIANVPESIKQQREKAKVYFDRPTQERPDLEVGQQVHVQLKHNRDMTWQQGIVTGRISDRAYSVEVNGSSYQRNDVDIKAKGTAMQNEAMIGAETVADDETLTTRQDPTPKRKVTQQPQQTWSMDRLRDRESLAERSKKNLQWRNHDL